MARKTTVVATTTALICNCMIRFLSSLNPRKTHIKQVSSFFSIKPHYYFSTTSLSSAHKSNNTHIDLHYINFTGIAKILISKYPCFLDKSESERQNLAENASLKELLLDISDIIPHVTRHFWRILRLKPEDVLEILLGFQIECEKVAIEITKVESLWGIFKLVSKQDKSFKHLPLSCEVMSLVLIRYGMLREVQLLLLAMERQGIPLVNNEIFSNLIEGYVAANDLERAVLVYDQAREQNLVPSLCCYHVLIDLLVRMRRTQLAVRVCWDMFEIGINSSAREMASLEKVVGLLSGDGMVQEARNLFKKAMASGFEPSNSIINEISSGYCEKKDFEDLLSFLVVMKCSPNLLVSNKIIYELCINYGVERSDFFRLELENLGFRPDEITFGILISWCCSEGNLRSAFVYLSDMLSRGLQPSIHSYNALIGAMFRTGMWKHARDILEEMVDRGTTPNFTTFRTLLAGYCKARQFDEVKMIIHKMVICGLIESSSLENPLSKAFTVLGLNPLSVRLKRDNNVGLYTAEFFDHLGNGLYLDTDVDEYEKKVRVVLDNSFIPDFNLLLREECDRGNIKAAFLLIDEMARWGQELSLSILLALVKRLCASQSCTNTYSRVIEKIPNLVNLLNDEVLNLLLRAYCRSGLTHKGKIIFHQMLMRDMTIENGTYTALMMGLCKRGDLRDFHYCWDIAQNSKWLPRIQDCKPLVECLFHHRMLKEGLELLESMLLSHPHSRSEIFHLFLEKLCDTGFTVIAQNFVDELLHQGCVFDGIAYSHLMRGFCKERNYTEALAILDKMSVKNLIPCSNVSLILIPKLCMADRTHRAVALSEICSRLQSASSFSFSIHCCLVSGFCKTGKVGEAANIVQNMLSKGLVLDAGIYDMLFQGYCQANNLRKVKELLGVLIRKFSSLSIANYQNLVRLMCMRGSFTSALSLKELMLQESKHNSLVIYNVLILYLFLADNSLLVDEILNELQEKRLPLDEVTCNFLVYGFSKCQNISSCLYYLSTMISKGFRPSNCSLRTAVTCLSDLGDLSKVLELSREMEIRGWVHGSVVQNAVVECLLSYNMIREAEDFLDRMVDKGLIPNTINYDNLIKQFCLVGRLNKAVDLMNIMLKKGNIPDSSSYDSVIHGLCTRNLLNEAMDFHIEMLNRDLKPSMKTWDMLLNKLCQHGQTAEAENLLICMVRFGETPTRSMYSPVINGYHVENNPRKASEIMEMMQQSGYQPDFDTHWSLITNLQSSKDKDNSDSSQGFLSSLLSASGLAYNKNSKVR